MDNMTLGGSIIVVNSQAASSPSINEIIDRVAKRAISSLVDSLQKMQKVKLIRQR